MTNQMLPRVVNPKISSNINKTEMNLSNYTTNENVINEANAIMLAEGAFTKGLGGGWQAKALKSGNGYRAELKNKEGKTSYLGSDSFENPEDAVGLAVAYYTAQDKGNGPTKLNKVIRQYVAKHKTK